MADKMTVELQKAADIIREALPARHRIAIGMLATKVCNSPMAGRQLRDYISRFLEIALMGQGDGHSEETNAGSFEDSCYSMFFWAKKICGAGNSIQKMIEEVDITGRSYRLTDDVRGIFRVMLALVLLCTDVEYLYAPAQETTIAIMEYFSYPGRPIIEDE
ncbi:MAG: hypothetical protein NT135_02230 [Candidatus Berkelbacteria bacterium]|nr:hypothetical protein [Candidatus Berkelbacteria bacterium]